jgi:hypothetical protein
MTVLKREALNDSTTTGIEGMREFEAFAVDNLFGI